MVNAPPVEYSIIILVKNNHFCDGVPNDVYNLQSLNLVLSSMEFILARQYWNQRIAATKIPNPQNRFRIDFKKCMTVVIYRSR